MFEGKPNTDAGTILVVDDNPALLYATARILRSNRYAVHQASNSRDALALAREHVPDLILLDVRLGDENGLDICRAIKTDPALERIFVVLVSGIDISSDIQVRGLLAGADGYIARPVSNEELVARVEALLRIKRTEAQVRYQLDYTRAITDSLAEGVVVYDTSGIITFLNPAAERFLGWTSDELIGQNYRRLILEQEPPSGQDSPFDAARRGERHVENIESNFYRKDGSSFSVLASSAPLYRNSTLSGAVLTFRDITVLKANEQEIRDLNENLERRVYERTAQLEQANKELEAFSYSVSHDLRAPFRHIAGFSQLLHERIHSKLDSQALHYLNTIIESARYAGGLIDDLLALARIGRAKLHMTKVNLNRLVRECRAALQQESEGRKLHWRVPELPIVEGDAGLLRLAFENLLSNAVKYTRTKPDAVIEIGCQFSSAAENHSDEYIFYVRDNGVGFDMRYANKLFGVFQRLHHDDEFEGTGIGLANVQRIIHRHGGTVWAESKEGEGATFYFTLPASLEVNVMRKTPLLSGD